jgi:hypothetical protein
MARSTKRESRGIIVRRFLCVSVLAAFASPASAQPAWPDGLVVDWQAPPGCPDDAYVRSRIVSTLSGSARSTALARPTTFRARVASAATGFQLEVRTTTADIAETKVVDAERCEMAAEAFALIVAFAVDPASSALPPASAPASPSLPSEPVAPSPPPSERTSVSSHAAERPSTAVTTSAPPLSLGPIVATGAGILPMPALAVGGAIALGASPRWELDGRYWPARQVDLTTDMGPGAVRVSLLSARVSGCVPWSEHGRWAACLGAELGRMRGEGVGVTSPDFGDSWWAAPSVGIAARLPIAPHFDVRWRLDVGVPFFRPRFTIQHADVPREVEGFRPAPIFATLTFEPELTFFATEQRANGHP